MVSSQKSSIYAPKPREITKHKMYPCKYFNTNDGGCRDRGCHDEMICAVCGSRDHGAVVCAQRKFCLAYNKPKQCNAGLGCEEGRHWCLMCHEKHSMVGGECAMYESRARGERDQPYKYCYSWNATGRCAIKGVCQKLHHCISCRGGRRHASSDCRHAINTLIKCEFGSA
jgi:hypothetical protein